MRVPFDLVIRGGQLVSEIDIRSVDLAIRDGRVAAHLEPGESAQAQQEIDASGLYLFPGVVDAHVHFNDPGRTHWEGFETGSRAAAAGGTTTVVDMPLNCSPVTTTGEALREKQVRVRGRSAVDYAFWGGLVDDNVAHLADLVAGGVAGAKAFLCHSGLDEFPRTSERTLRAAIREMARLDTLLLLHAEDEEGAATHTARLQAEGRKDRRAWAEGRPPETEVSAIRRVLAMLEEEAPTLRTHFVHTSVGDGFRLVEAARQRGLRVTAETCPHYLLLDVDDLERIGPRAKCAPPLRARPLVEDLWSCLLAGQVSLVASDHSPCPPEDKARGDDDIWLAWGGISGVQTLLVSLLDEGVHRRGLTLSALTRLTAANPARLTRLWPRKGHLGVGADADVAVVDLHAQWTLLPPQLMTRYPANPLVGRTFTGQVVRTLLRGETVYRDGGFTYRQRGQLLDTAQ